MIERQRADGGFWCKDTGRIGGPRESEPRCAYATLCVLGALAVYPRLRQSDVAKRSVAFLLRCWDKRGKIKFAGHDSQIGKGWEKLKYPFTDYRILKYLDVVSRLPYAITDPRLLEMRDLLASKQDCQGRFSPESIPKTWSDFDFGQKKIPSRWITLCAHRIFKRINVRA